MLRIFKQSPEYFNLITFSLFYLISLTFVYIEGDDASTVAYHAMGRNAEIQEPYSAYHGMVDTLLSLLPGDEPVLRHFAIGISAISAFLFVFLCVKLVKAWTNTEVPDAFMLFALLLPFIIPELVFFGLIYMPSALAMSLILGGHLIIRKSFSENKNYAIAVPLSLILYGLGTSFRWDVAVYGIVIFADLAFILFQKKRVDIKNIFGVLIWSGLAIISVLFFIYLSGYPPSKIIAVIGWAEEYLGGKKRSIIKTITVSQSLFTPAFLLLFLTGIIQGIVKKRFDILVIGLVGFLPKLYLGLSVSPKGLIMAIPGFILIAFWGFQWLMEFGKKQLTVFSGKMSIYAIAIIIIILIPWIIGIQVQSKSTSWGPGFEISYKESLKTDRQQHLDDRIKLGDISLSLLGGIATPSAEGPRPLWGYGYVLLGGGWRTLVSKMNNERDEVIEKALKGNMPILHNNKYKLIYINLLAKGFKEKYDFPKPESDLYKIRKFVKESMEVDIYFLKKATIYNKAKLYEVSKITGKDQFVCWFLYSSDISRLKEVYKDETQVTGPFSAMLNLNNKDSPVE